MDSSDLYHVRQRFTLCAYKSIANLTLPDTSAEDYPSILLYKARALIALGQPEAAEALVPEDTENFALRAARALAVAVRADSEDETALETLRDLCVEIDGEEDTPANNKWHVRVLAGTAFARAGEVEEALETLGVGTNTESLEAVALVVQIYLSISRADLAKREYQRALVWGEDDLLLQSIEATIGLATGADSYSNGMSYFTELLANPSLSSPHAFIGRATARLLRGEVQEARSDLEEVLREDPDNEDALCVNVVSAGLDVRNKEEAEQLYGQLSSKHPENLLVRSVGEKSALFDHLVSKFDVPPLAVTS